MATQPVDFPWFDLSIDLRDNLTEARSRLASKEANEALTDAKGVYLIHVNPPLALCYPKGVSNIIYIGSGKTWNRISQGHHSWMERGERKLGLKFSLSFGCPRVRNSVNAYKMVEGDILNKFRTLYGDFPLLNKQSAAEGRGYTYTDAVLSVISRPISESYYGTMNLFIGHLFDDLVPESP